MFLAAAAGGMCFVHSVYCFKSQVNSIVSSVKWQQKYIKQYKTLKALYCRKYRPPLCSQPTYPPQIFNFVEFPQISYSQRKTEAVCTQCNPVKLQYVLYTTGISLAMRLANERRHYRYYDASH